MTESSPEDVSGDSSPAEAVNEATPAGAAPEKSALDAVEEALSKGVDAESPSATSNRSEETDPQPDGVEKAPEDDNGEISDEEKRQMSPRAQERIRDLAAQKNAARAEVERLTAEMEPVRAKAANFEALTSYLTENGISAKEANNALEITRLIKGHDYGRALEIVAPIYGELVRRTGGVLDNDLREDVRLGHITVERAQEIQRGRASELTAREREQNRAAREEQSRQTAEQRRYAGFVDEVARDADAWAKEKADSDPDWNQKADLVAAQVNVIITAEGFPKSKAEARKISERALAEVEKRIGAFRPKPTAINPARHTGSASARDLPPPKTALEALERGLQQARG